MAWSAEPLISARNTLGRLLEELELADYLFGIEPSERGWQVRVECRCRDGSHEARFGLEGGVLERCH